MTEATSQSAAPMDSSSSGTCPVSGDIVDNGSLLFANSSDWTVNGNVNGTGGVTDKGLGTVTFASGTGWEGRTVIVSGYFYKANPTPWQWVGTNAANNDWSTSTNWTVVPGGTSDGTYPQPGDKLFFQGTGEDTVNDLGDGFWVGSIDFKSSGFSLSGDSITLLPSGSSINGNYVSIAVDSGVTDATVALDINIPSAGSYGGFTTLIDVEGGELTLLGRHPRDSFSRRRWWQSRHEGRRHSRPRRNEPRHL